MHTNSFTNVAVTRHVWLNSHDPNSGGVSEFSAYLRYISLDLTNISGYYYIGLQSIWEMVVDRDHSQFPSKA
jgi:hypothetical protein